MSGRRSFLLLSLLGLLMLAGEAASAQTVSGRVFEDRDGDGIRDPGEPGVAGVAITLLGQRDAVGPIDIEVFSGSDGAFSFSPGNGCYLLRPGDPPGWRASQARADLFPETTPGYRFPVGEPRWGKLDQGVDSLRAGQLRYTSMGDSIAWNWNSCFYASTFWYSRQVRSRLQCAAPAASITLDEVAVKGEHTDDLLVDDHDDLNNVFRVIEIQPELITLSMIGNDLLGVDEDNPTRDQINRAVEEILDARQNLQEALSVMVSEVPGADISLNSLYDNEAFNCDGRATTAFHRDWVPIINRMLRDLAWGQARRLSVNEVAAEFAQEDLAGGCSGFEGKICRDIFQTDNIHPNNDGYTVIREKVWEAVGGVQLGSRDALGRDAVSDVDYGLLRRVRRLFPSTWETRNGATVADPDAAFAHDGVPARVTLGIGQEEFRLGGLPDWFDEITVVRAVAGVRYRTTGTVTDDFYRMEASVSGEFRPPPGFDYTTTNWNFYTPLVGGGGPGQPALKPDYTDARLLALPQVSAYREVSATLTKNPVRPDGAASYEWPALTHDELARTTFRVAAAPVGSTPGNDAYQVELDAAWVDLYGWEKPRPPEVPGLLAQDLVDGTLEVSFEALTGVQRYNLYFGRLATLHGGSYDHGADAPAGPECGAPDQDAGSGRRRIDVPPGSQPVTSSYFLVTAHVDDVEAPAGTRSGALEIDRSQSICR